MTFFKYLNKIFFFLLTAGTALICLYQYLIYLAFSFGGKPAYLPFVVVMGIAAIYFSFVAASFALQDTKYSLKDGFDKWTAGWKIMSAVLLLSFFFLAFCTSAYLDFKLKTEDFPKSLYH